MFLCVDQCFGCFQPSSRTSSLLQGVFSASLAENYINMVVYNLFALLGGVLGNLLAVNAYLLAVQGYLLAVNPDLLAVNPDLLAVNPDLLAVNFGHCGGKMR